MAKEIMAELKCCPQAQVRSVLYALQGMSSVPDLNTSGIRPFISIGDRERLRNLQPSPAARERSRAAWPHDSPLDWLHNANRFGNPAFARQLVAGLFP